MLSSCHAFGLPLGNVCLATVEGQILADSLIQCCLFNTLHTETSLAAMCCSCSCLPFFEHTLTLGCFECKLLGISLYTYFA